MRQLVCTVWCLPLNSFAEWIYIVIDVHFSLLFTSRFCLESSAAHIADAMNVKNEIAWTTTTTTKEKEIQMHSELQMNAIKYSSSTQITFTLDLKRARDQRPQFSFFFFRPNVSIRHSSHESFARTSNARDQSTDRRFSMWSASVDLQADSFVSSHRQLYLFSCLWLSFYVAYCMFGPHTRCTHYYIYSNIREQKKNKKTFHFLGPAQTSCALTAKNDNILVFKTHCQSKYGPSIVTKRWRIFCRLRCSK